MRLANNEVFEDLSDSGVRPVLYPHDAVGYHCSLEKAAIVPDNVIQTREGPIGAGAYFAEQLPGKEHAVLLDEAFCLVPITNEAPREMCCFIRATLSPTRCYIVMSQPNKEFYKLAYDATVEHRLQFGDGSEMHVTIFNLIREILEFYSSRLDIQATKFSLLRDGHRQIETIMVTDLRCVSSPLVASQIQD